MVDLVAPEAWPPARVMRRVTSPDSAVKWVTLDSKEFRIGDTLRPKQAGEAARASFGESIKSHQSKAGGRVPLGRPSLDAVRLGCTA